MSDQEALKIAIDALKRISNVRQAFEDHSGRCVHYRDFELRMIAQEALKKIEELSKGASNG